MRLVPSKMYKPSSKFITDRSKAVLLLWILLLFVFSVCLHTVLSVTCSLAVTCLGRVLLYVMRSCVLVTFPYSVLGQVWYVIVSIPDLCFLPYFVVY